MPPGKEQRNPIVAPPTEETLAYAKKYQEKMAKIKTEKEAQRQKRAMDGLKVARAKREEELKNRPTARELSETLEFKTWCQERGIAPTKRAAATHRAEYEKFLAQQEEAIEQKQQAA